MYNALIERRLTYSKDGDNHPVLLNVCSTFI